MEFRLRLQPIRVSWQAATTMALACTAASGAGATTISFSPTNGNLQISLAGSESPLYSLTSVSSVTSSTKTTMECSDVGKYGGCNGPLSPVFQTTTTQFDGATFNSLQSNALIGMVSSTDTMPTADEAFSTKSQEVWHSGLTTVSPQPYSQIPYTPIRDTASPLAGKYVHLKFDVDDTDYLGLASFDQSAKLASIDYSAAGPSLVEANALADVPEPDSWMLLTAGLGLAGAAVRRGRARAARAVAA
jgi:hypothetical protein